MPPAAAAVRSKPARAPRARAAVPRGDKRDAILRAAIRTFARSGFFSAQVADVARTAGVAAGTVYLYFRSKDDLLVSIFERVMSEAIAEGRAALAGIVDPLERLRRIAHLHLDRLSRDRDLAIVFQSAAADTKFMERFSNTLSGVSRHLREVMPTARPPASSVPHQPDAGASALRRPREMATNWMLSHRRTSLDGVADAVIDPFVHGVGVRRSGKGQAMMRTVTVLAPADGRADRAHAANAGFDVQVLDASATPPVTQMKRARRCGRSVLHQGHAQAVRTGSLETDLDAACRATGDRGLASASTSSTPVRARRRRPTPQTIVLQHLGHPDRRLARAAARASGALPRTHFFNPPRYLKLSS